MDYQDGYSALAPYYDIFIDWPGRLASEIPFIISTLPSDHDNIRCLDIGCGTGRHLERLADQGLHPEGAEPSSHLRKYAQQNLPDVAIHSAGMDQLGELAADYGPWELVTCLGNTLPHLEPSSRPIFFSSLAAALAPGAVAVLHSLGYDRILRDRPGELQEKTVCHQGRQYIFQRLYEYRDNKIIFKLNILQDGKQLSTQSETLHPLTGSQLSGLCREAGLSEVTMFDGFDSSKPYETGSANLVCVIVR
ncbi:MAG: class I SAM-dependent methyltransferase [Chloroflexi bacterium]|nr:class I SAM-dependent methyltransferase [Chloroflexota bacterium]